MLENLTTWKILGIISIIALIVSFSRRNAIWGGATGGAIIGIITAFFRNGNYDWYYVAKFAIVGALSGIIAELLGLVSLLIRRKNI